MEYLLQFFFFVVYFVLASCVGRLAKSKGYDPLFWFSVSVFASPLGGVIYLHLFMLTDGSQAKDDGKATGTKRRYIGPKQKTAWRQSGS